MKNKFKELFNNNKLIVVILMILIVIIVVIYFSLYVLRNTSYAIEDSDNVVIDCPDVGAAGSSITCEVWVNLVTDNVEGFQTKLTSNGLEYVSFEDNTDTWYEVSGAPEPDGNDVILIATTIAENGDDIDIGKITGETLLGSVTYNIPNNAESNQFFTLTASDNILVYVDDNENVLDSTLPVVSDTIRTKSRINTLDSIQLSSGSIKETVSTNNNNYTASVSYDVDVISIDVTKTDSNSSISENLDGIELHYGTNSITFDVISETGDSNTYTINIFRSYEYSSDKYVYDNTNNYLYTRSDSDSETIISNLIPMEGNVTPVIDGNVLKISYEDEELFSVNLINIESIYKISNGNMYVGKNVDYNEFNNNIVLNGVTLKVFNNENEVVSGTLTSDCKVRVYYNNNLIEEYNVVEEYLSIDDLIVVEEKNVIRILKDTTYHSIKEKINTSGTIIIKDKGGNVLSDNDKVKTNDSITIDLTEDVVYYISVLGDLNGDGVIDIGDVSGLYRYSKGKVQLNDYQALAADLNGDGLFNIGDVSGLYRYSKNKLNFDNNLKVVS